MSRNLRVRALLIILIVTTLFVGILINGVWIDTGNLTSHLSSRNQSPSLVHWFGTDWLGRDMFARTVKGLSVSIGVGLLATIGSVLISLILGLAAATFGKTVDRMVTWLVDLFLSLPHLVSLILISFALGGGLKGVIVGIALTHWPSLTRLIRAEVLQLRSAEYVQLSRRLGKSRWWIARKHMLPHLRPQIMVGSILLFPHAVLHEAAITFLGLGLSPHQPAIGIILSESMRYLSAGMWWLAFFPGLCLLIVVRAFDLLGEQVGLMIDPHRTRH